MTDIERGLHPWRRVVRRLSRISPHRQIQLLCLISVVTVVIMVTAVLGSLGPTHDSLEYSSKNLAPTIKRLDTARDKFVAASTTVVLTANAATAVRASAITDVAALYSRGEAVWNDYLKHSVHLRGERALQLRFIADRKAAFDAGSALVSEPVPSTASIATVTRYSDALRLDLNSLRRLYEVQVQQALTESTQQVSSTQQEILRVSGAALLLLLIAFGVASRSARSREERTEILDRALHDDADRNELEARLQRSLEMAHTEAATYPVVGRALTLSAPGVPAELLVADSSRSHFHQVATVADSSGPRCPVTSPTDCPAASWGQTQIWNSSTALDACPHLQNRPDGECAAVCVPVSLGGKTVGVLHATAPDQQPPDVLVVAKIELIARKVGERIGMLRAFLRSETQAHTDPLTGLMNRRSLEEQVREIGHDRPYVAAYGDLDHFKQLNDVYGHDAGDQALRLFARVLRETVRPNDLTARYGGEEFVVVLPNCAPPDAFTVVDRIREALALAQISAEGPRFTVSFGIASSRAHQSFSQTLDEADTALLEAKAQGRDRVIVAGLDGQSTGAQSTGSSSEPVSSEAPTISSTRS